MRLKKSLITAWGLILIIPVTLCLWADQTGTVPNQGETALEPRARGELSPGLDDGRIAYVVAKLLEVKHYRQLYMDDEVSEQFFDRYINLLDPQHLHFTRADLAEWEDYRHTLDDLTLASNTQPALVVFERFRERLTQRVEFVDDAITKPDTFDFTKDERILINRKDEPFPKDLAAAKKLWLERLRFEILQEKLGKGDPDEEGDSDSEKPEVDGHSTVAKGELDLMGEIVTTITNRYHRNLRLFNDWDHNDVLEQYLSSLAHVYDPHSEYFNESSSENFAISMSLSLFGIGAQLRWVDGYCTIEKLLPGGPAYKSGKLNVKDRIVAVAQGREEFVDVVDMALSKAVQLIRGPKGTEVRLAVLPKDSSERRVISLIRDEIPLEDQAAKAKIVDLPGESGETTRIGVIELPSFYTTTDLSGERRESELKSATTDVAQLLRKLKEEEVAGVILDLRYNGGGSLEEAVNLTGLFIKSGPVVQVHDPYGATFVDSDHDGGQVLYDGPLVVLTSRFSASASEILAGALQDYGRALIVGDISTHGKGTVQSLQRLAGFVGSTNDPGTLKVTIRKFYRAGGVTTQLRGVTPDIVLPSERNYWKEIGEAAQENAMAPGEPREPARFEPVDRVAAYLGQLMQRSNRRIATNQDYVYVHEDIERYRARLKDQSVSLNEAERIREKKEDEERDKARKEERAARPPSQTKIYLITLKDVDKPGLPEPDEAEMNVTGATLTPPRASAAVGGTNANASVSTAVTRENSAAPASDAMLDEAGRILVDYISLLSQKGLATVNRAAGTP